MTPTTHLLVGFHAQVLEKLPNGHYSASPLADERRQTVIECESLDGARARLAAILAALAATTGEPSAP